MIGIRLPEWSKVKLQKLWNKVTEFRVYEPMECCCCLGPRVAAIAVAMFNFIAYTLHIVHMCIYLGSSYNEFRIYCYHRTRGVDLNYCANWMIWFIYSTTATAVLTLIATCVLCYGISKSDPKYVLAYLGVKVFTMTYYGLISAGFVFFIVMNHYWGWLYGALLLGPLGLFWEVFFFLLVRVYYKKLLYPEYYVPKPAPDPEEVRDFDILKEYMSRDY